MKTLLVVCICALLGGLTGPAAAFQLKGDPKVAFIYAASAQDGGWNEAFENSRRLLEDELGLEIARTESIPEEATAIRGAIDLYVERGYNIIVGTGYGYSDGILEAAKEYPDVAFLNAAGITNAANLESFYARTYQGWYLAGMIAGSMAGAGKMGMLAGFPIGLVNWDVNAFIRGARAVNADAEVIAAFTNSWWDPVKEGQIAEAMLSEGAGVIATDLSAASALNAAEVQGKYSVGFQLDMSSHAPKGHLVSVVFRWEKFLAHTIRKIVDGRWEPSEWGAFIGMDLGVVDLAGIHPDVPKAVLDRVAETRAAMAAGTFSPFDGPVYRQDGSTVVAAGETISDEALWEMDYFVQGAIGTMPAN